MCRTDPHSLSLTWCNWQLVHKLRFCRQGVHSYWVSASWLTVGLSCASCSSAVRALWGGLAALAPPKSWCVQSPGAWAIRGAAAGVPTCWGACSARRLQQSCCCGMQCSALVLGAHHVFVQSWVMFESASAVPAPTCMAVSPCSFRRTICEAAAI